MKTSRKKNVNTDIFGHGLLFLLFTFVLSKRNLESGIIKANISTRSILKIQEDATQGQEKLWI